MHAAPMGARLREAFRGGPIMKRFQRLLLICDPEGAPSPALATAEALARASGASVHVCAFVHSEMIEWVGLVDRAAMEKARDGWLLQRRAAVQGLANTLEARGVAATADVAWCHPVHEEMLRQIRELQPDLVIKDARYEASILKRMLFTPTDGHLMRRCAVPLLLAHPGHPPLPRTIVAAVDPGPYEPDTQDLNQRIVGLSGDVARACGASLHLAFVVTPTTDVASALGSAPASFSTEAITAVLAMRTKAFEGLARVHEIPAERRHLLAGRVGPAVADLATRRAADLLVIGATHRNRLDRWLMGSAAEQIADDAPCSVLVVPPGQGAPLPKR
jgi:universal stress protein E